ncbi:Acriflavin resistance protein [Desulfamplus magnetovallimortis]|uniref:Acriflavin resistance protein n=1 Tax=Desulfamplus magnetovallimortis TaxID=1246637 RepID=A0A1W1H856_9BACT|nr:efflux RND transporter permease subunit [Desulfamplus magnetovallimortis]SLM28651.1 Acriflavin resistance protein [Desulfamplus magnetovallimortis]
MEEKGFENSGCNHGGEESEKQGIITAFVEKFLDGKLSIMLMIISLCLGAASLVVTPKEEEPQIVVPLADIYVSVPGASAEEVEQLVATPLEQFLWQIDGVEYVYSMSKKDMALVTVRFFVGENREDSLVKLHNRISMNMDKVTSIVKGWVIKPVEIDDVSIVNIALYSESHGSDELRRIGEEVIARIGKVENISRTTVHGGRSREIRVELVPEKMQAMSVSFMDVQGVLYGADASLTAGAFSRSNHEYPVMVSSFLGSVEEIESLVVGVTMGRPVYLRDVALIKDTPEEARSYSRILFSDSYAGGVKGNNNMGSNAKYSAVTLAVSKKRGTNAVTVADDVILAFHELAPKLLPDGVYFEITRNYGETAHEKVNDLLGSLLFAVASVVVLLAFTLGWREALIVAFAVPISFSLALFVNYLFGYTINRVTLFALILSLGLVVDDPITNVENIQRHIQKGILNPFRATLRAVNEVLPPVIMSTLAIIACFIPLFFITGMMGPYMAPMAANVPLTVTFSTLCALTIVPWLSYILLKSSSGKVSELKESTNISSGASTATSSVTSAGTSTGASAGASTGASTATSTGTSTGASSGTSAGALAGTSTAISSGTSAEVAAEVKVPESSSQSSALEKTLLFRIYRSIVEPFLNSGFKRFMLFFMIVILLGVSCSLAVFRKVPLKLLPFDNKNEFQIVIDMDEGTTLEHTDSVVQVFEDYLRSVPEVTSIISFTGESSPMDFNGMVRHYYLRKGSNYADIRVNLLPKDARDQQSHGILLRLRGDLEAIAESNGAKISLVEVPPGPPVLSTIVGEIYGSMDLPHEKLVASSEHLLKVMKDEPFVVDIDAMTEKVHDQVEFVIDREKAALHGIDTKTITATIGAALNGVVPAFMHLPRERQPLKIRVTLPRELKSGISDLKAVPVKSAKGRMISLAELVTVKIVSSEQTIYHKNLERVVYVLADTAGRAPAEAVLDMQSRLKNDPMPHGVRVDWDGEGEWKITLRVFRDMGIAFAAALVGIYILLIIQSGSFLMPGLIMMAIPLTLLGILPGFLLLNTFGTVPVGGFENPVFLTATSMIGMIALGGIVIRNSLVLIEFIQDAMNGGLPFKEAILQSGAIRMRPILLTALTTAIGAFPITLDPVFSGLAWALIFGLFASTLFTLLVIPVTYFAVYRRKFS